MKINTTTKNIISVSSTNANSYQSSVARVYSNGVKVAEQFINTRNPVAYLSDRLGGEHLESFRQQLTIAMGDSLISLEDVQAIQKQTGINIGYKS